MLQEAFLNLFTLTPIAYATVQSASLALPVSPASEQELLQNNQGLL